MDSWWAPGGLHMDAWWTPGGLLVDSTWTSGGVHMGYLRSPQGEVANLQSRSVNCGT
jgi:hypothetical protein